MSTTLNIAVRNITRHKARSALTIFGILVGIGLVMVLGGITEGLNQQLQDQFQNMAATITVSDSGGDGIDDDVVEEIRGIPGVESVVETGTYNIERNVRGNEMGFGTKSGGIMMDAGRMPGEGSFGVSITFTAIPTEEFSSIVSDEIGVLSGRKLEGSDEGTNYVVLGYSLAEAQGLNVGDEIEYIREIKKSQIDEDETREETHYFEVVGILEEADSDDIDKAAYVPLDTMQNIEEDDKISKLVVTVTDVDVVEEISEEIENRVDDVSVRSAITMVRQLESMLGGVQLALLGIGAVAVFVGGLGIINTMLTSVMERRRDMGVMKAVGATEKMILSQVITEAVIMSLIGGIGGILIGYIAERTMPGIIGMDVVMSPFLVILGLGFAVLLGVFSGIYPAHQASKLDPVEVLAYE